MGSFVKCLSPDRPFIALTIPPRKATIAADDRVVRHNLPTSSSRTTLPSQRPTPSLLIRTSSRIPFARSCPSWSPSWTACPPLSDQ